MFRNNLQAAYKVRLATAQRASGDESGSVAIIFALTLTAVIMFAGCAVDIGRAGWARARLTSAVDATTLYAAKQLRVGNIDIATLEPLARAFFDRNMNNAGRALTINGFALGLTNDGTGVTVAITADMPTTFARVAGIKTIHLPQNATAKFNEQSQNVEVSLQLDVTGSMNESINGTRKIDSLKTASNSLLDILLPKTGNGGAKFRVGLAPFAAGVNAGPYANAVAGTKALGGCVFERRDSFNDATDTLPAGLDGLKTVKELGPGANAIAPACPTTATVTALTSDRAKLQPTIDALAPGGWTAGHLGTTWAWGLLSPNWSPIWPAASAPASYSDTQTRKIAILMTDGIYNTFGGTNDGTELGGSFGVTARDRAVALCAGMRAKGITVYTVGFIKSGDNAAAADTLKSCAKDESHFYKAEDGEQLDFAFRDIAQKISALRLTN